MATSSVVHSSICFLVFFSIVVLIPSSSGQQSCIPAPIPFKLSDPYTEYLSPHYYDSTCPNVYEIVGDIVQKAIDCERRMGASLVRLHFHDAWVNGADGSVLLVDRPGFTGEQSAGPNANSLRGFDVIGAIKSALNEKCPCGNVVSCADILAIAASESVKRLGGPCYKVLLGRKDSLTASKDAAEENLPFPSWDVSTLLANFASHNFGPIQFTAQDLVALSGCHTIGRSRCGAFIDRAKSNQNINSDFATELRDNCTAGVASSTAPLDNTTNTFDLNYFKMLQDLKGLLTSDQELLSGGDTGTAFWVNLYSGNQAPFWTDFITAMIKLGSLPPTDDQKNPQFNVGEVRCNCGIPNSINNNNGLPDLRKVLTCPSISLASTCPRSTPVVLTSLFNNGANPTPCTKPVGTYS